MEAVPLQPLPGASYDDEGEHRRRQLHRTRAVAALQTRLTSQFKGARERLDPMMAGGAGGGGNGSGGGGGDEEEEVAGGTAGGSVGSVAAAAAAAAPGSSAATSS